MDSKQKQLIEEQMNQVPTEVRDAIKASDWERVVFNIGREHKLHIDQIDVLSVETIMTMLGIVNPKEYFDYLDKNLGADEETLLDIVEDVNEKLFSKIREALKKVYTQESADSIMADDEKEVMYSAGIGLDDYEPKPKPKAPDLTSVIDTALKTETISKVEEEETFTPIHTKVKEEKVDFDPYREPII